MPVGLDEGSLYASVCVPSGGNPIRGASNGGSEREIPAAEWETLSGGNPTSEGFNSRRTIEKSP